MNKISFAHRLRILASPPPKKLFLIKKKASLKRLFFYSKVYFLKLTLELRLLHKDLYLLYQQYNQHLDHLLKF